MNNLINYITEIIFGIWRLLQGMFISMLNFVRPTITEQYPENRGKRKDFERFRAMLVMPHNADNRHRCTACGICAMNCPNGSISIASKKVADETGKEKRVLDAYTYDLGCCMFCGLCVNACPQDAIEWSPTFEQAVFTRYKLLKCLNNEGSSIQQ